MKKFILAAIAVLAFAMTNAQTEADSTKTQLTFSPELVVSSNYIWRGAIFADKPFVTLANTATYGKLSVYASFDYAPFNDNMFDLFAMPSYSFSDDLTVSANYFYWGNYIDNTVYAKHYLDFTVRAFDLVEAGAMLIDPYRTSEKVSDYAAFAAISRQFSLNNNYSFVPRVQVSLTDNVYYGEAGKFSAETALFYSNEKCKYLNWASLTVGYTNHGLNYYSWIDADKAKKFYANLSISVF